MVSKALYIPHPSEVVTYRLLTYKLFSDSDNMTVWQYDNILIHIPPETLKTQCELGSSYERLTR